MQSARSFLHWLTVVILVFLVSPAWAQTPEPGSLAPASATAGSSGLTPAVNGGEDSTDRSSSAERKTASTTASTATPVADEQSAPQVTAELPASLIFTTGSPSGTASTSWGTAVPFARATEPPSGIFTPAPVTTAVNGGISAVNLSSAAASSASATNSSTTAPQTTNGSATLPTAPASLNPTTGIVHVTIGSYGSSGSSNPLAVNPPTISALSPASAVAGGAAFTLTVNGAYFTAGSAILWNSTLLATTYLSDSQLTATISATMIASASTASISVSAAGGISSSVAFTVNPNTVPVINDMSPSVLPAGFGSFTMVLFGTNFGLSPSVQWGSTTLAVMGSWNILWVTVPASLVATAGTANITVIAKYGTSAPAVFTIKPPIPTISSLSPASIPAGSPSFTLTVTGSNFVPNSYIIFNGNWLWAYDSPTQLSAVVPDSMITTAGTATITTYVPGAYHDSSIYSGLAVFTITPSPPTLSSLSPSSVVEGYAGFMMTVNGATFTQDSTVMWGATPLYTVYVSPTQLRADVLPSLLTNIGTASVSVANSAGTSASRTFTINQAAPNIGGLTPAVTTAGGAAFTMTITGQYFTPTSTVKWGSTPLTATYISTTQLTVPVSASLIATASKGIVTVTNSVGTSGSATFTINPMVAISTSSLPAGTVGNAYSGSISATGGSPGYNWTVTGLPSSMTFTSTFDSTMSITGTPTSAGTITVQVSVTDTAGATAGPVNYTINIAAAGSGVNNARLNGSYTCLMQGTYDEDGSRWASVANFQADGKGNFTNGIFDTNSHDIGTGSGTLTGSYNIGSDNNGQAYLRTVLTEGAAGIQTIQWALAISTSVQPASHFRMVEIDDLGTLPSGQQGSANCYLVTPSAFVSSSISGSSFVFALDGEDNSGILKSAVGRFSASAGQITNGYIDSALGGIATIHSTAFTATYTAPDPATGRFQIALQGGVNPTGLTVYIIDANRMFVLDNTNNSGEQAGNLLAQQQASTTAATVNGPFVLYLRGAQFSSGSAPSGFYSNLMQGSADGAGNLTIHQNYSDNNGVYSTSKSISGLSALAIDSAHPGRATFISASGTTYLYLFNSNSAVEMSVGANGSLDSGWLQPQSQSTFTNAALAGNYLVGEMPLLSGASVANVGEYNLTSAGAINGYATFTGEEYLSWDQSISMTYTWDATAPNTGAFLIANGTQGNSSCVVVSATQFVCTAQTDPAPTIQLIGQ